MIDDDKGGACAVEEFLCLPDEHGGFWDEWGFGEALMGLMGGTAE